MTKKYVRFTEINRREGERWNFWLDASNGAALDDLAAFIEDDDRYTLNTDRVLTSAEVDLLVEFSDDEDRYMAAHHKVDGTLRFPDGFDVDDLHKGRVRHLFTT